MPLDLQTAIGLFKSSIPVGVDAATEINLVCSHYLDVCDPPGSLERVTFTVTVDVNGEGYIELPSRYQAIRGAVENPTSTSPCGWPLRIQNGWYEYAPGNLGMLKGTNALEGIIPIPKTAPTDPVKYKVPVPCPTEGTNAYFTCICKLAFTMLENDTDILPIQNLDAIEKGLEARNYRRAKDTIREKQSWAEGETYLQRQKDNETGPEAYGKVQFDDDYGLGTIGDLYGCYEGGWGYGEW